MTSIATSLPQCDCINDCGDDDNVAKGLRQRCSRYDEIQAENLDNEALRLLSNAMRSKLAASRRKGRSGWNDKTQCTAEYLSQLLREHVEKGDPVDVANFCAFLSARGEGIAPQAAPITAAASGKWQELAARVMDALANAQDRTNAEYPEHVKCYPSWETKPRYLRWLAEMFRTGKPIGNGAGQPDVLAALCATTAAAAPVEAIIKWQSGAGLLWDVHAFGKWGLRVVSPLNWDAHSVHKALVRAGYAEHIDVTWVHAEYSSAPEAQAGAQDAVTQAVRDYHFALDNRQHGGVAAQQALDSIQAALDLHWVQGAEASTRATISTQEAQP